MSKRFSKLRLVLLTALATYVVPSFHTTAVAENLEKLHADWTIKVETEQLSRPFNYKGSLRPVAKASVFVYPTGNEDQKKPYEYVWFQDGKPIGLERLDKFSLQQGKSAVIEVSHKAKGGQEEEKAVANLSLRLVLDSYHNLDSVIAIKLPPQSFDGVVAEMMHLNCTEVNPSGDESSKSKVTFTLQADPDGPVKHLFFL